MKLYSCYIAIIILFLFGCKSAPEYRETRIIDTVFSVAPPAIHDTLRAINYDTVVVAERINGRDTVIRVRYYPRTNTVTVYAKPDTVRFRYRDTTVIYSEKTYRQDGIGWLWLITIVVVGGAVYIIYVIRRK